MKNIIAFILAGASAYSFSLAVDLLLGGLLGIYPSTAFLPVVTWSVIAAIAGLIALRLATKRFLVIPFVLFGLLALFGGIVGHRYSLLVGLIMLGQAAGVWFATSPALVKNDAHEGSGPATSRGNRQKIRRGLAPNIGQHRLGIKTTVFTGLSEVTPIERAILGSVVEFRNERIYHASPANFAGVSWEIILGAVDDQVYKISALVESSTRGQRDAEWGTVDAQLQASLGPPATQSATIRTWDTEDGNVVMNRAEDGGFYFLVLTITSRAVSGFVPIR